MLMFHLKLFIFLSEFFLSGVRESGLCQNYLVVSSYYPLYLKDFLIRPSGHENALNNSYGKFQEDSKDKQFQYTIDEERAALLSKWLNIYQSQAMMKWTWKMYVALLRKIRT